MIRAALPAFGALSRARLFALARRASVESRLIVRSASGDWRLEHGPFERSAFPPLEQPGWTLLVQGVNLHDEAAHALLQRFRFVPDARIDDVMVSWASRDGGVGPHVDSYDVFLLQAHGRRRWRIGRTTDTAHVPDAPLKILKRFEPDQELVLAPGDMLYLPPQWAHDGTAVDGACMTYSIGFRAPTRAALAAALLERLTERRDDDEGLYRDSRLTPARRPASIPAELQSFAVDAVRRLLDAPEEIHAALGEHLTEPKDNVTFAATRKRWRTGAVVLDRRTRMLYDARHVYINGDSYRASGDDAKLMRRLADERALDAAAVRGASRAARTLLGEWFRAGWLHLRG